MPLEHGLKGTKVELNVAIDYLTKGTKGAIVSDIVAEKANLVYFPNIEEVTRDARDASKNPWLKQGDKETVKKDMGYMSNSAQMKTIWVPAKYLVRSFMKGDIVKVKQYSWMTRGEVCSWMTRGEVASNSPSKYGQTLVFFPDMDGADALQANLDMKIFSNPTDYAYAMKDTESLPRHKMVWYHLENLEQAAEAPDPENDLDNLLEALWDAHKGKRDDLSTLLSKYQTQTGKSRPGFMI